MIKPIISWLRDKVHRRRMREYDRGFDLMKRLIQETSAGEAAIHLCIHSDGTYFWLGMRDALRQLAPSWSVELEP